MPIPETTDIGELIRFFKKDKPEASHKQIVAIAINVAEKNKEKKASVTTKNQEEEEPQTGPEAIARALEKIDINEVEAKARDTIKNGKKTHRNAAVSLLKIVEGMKRNGQKPSDLMISKVPVIPPNMRPFSAQGGTFIPGDANVLYKDLQDILKSHKEEVSIFGEKNAGTSGLDLYDAVRSVYGYGEAVKPKTKAKGIQGFLHTLTGSTSKFGFVNRKLLSKTQDSTGRSTIIVEPDYNIDEIGLPEPMAFKMYAPYIQRRLKMSGMSDSEALRHTKERDDMAKRALEKEMEVRPVVYSRAPAWHKFSILGGKPRLVEGNAIKVNPYVAKGQGADYDGDANRCCLTTYVIFSTLKKSLLEAGLENLHKQYENYEKLLNFFKK